MPPNTKTHRRQGAWEEDELEPQGPKLPTKKKPPAGPTLATGKQLGKGTPPLGTKIAPGDQAAQVPLGANRRESFRKVPSSAYADWNIPGITGITGDAGRPPTQAQRKAGLQKLIATVEERSLALEAQVNASSAEAAADLQADVLADLAAFDAAVQARLTTLAEADAAQQLSASALVEAAASQRALACEERQAALTSARDATRGEMLARRDSASAAVTANARAAATSARDQAAADARRLRADGKSTSKRLRDEDARRQAAEAKEAAKAAEEARKHGQAPKPLTPAERQQRAEQETKAKAKAKAELDARVKAAQKDALAEADARLAEAEAQAQEALRAAAAEVERIKVATGSAIEALDRSLATALAQLAQDRDALAGHLDRQVAEVRRRAQAELQATGVHVRKIGELGREEANRKYAEGVRTLEADGRHLDKARKRMPELRKALIARLTAGDLGNLKALRDDADATMGQIRQLHGRCLQRYQDLSEGIGTLLALGEQPPGPIVPVIKRVDARLERATGHLTGDGAVLEQAGAILLAKTVATMDATQDQQEAAFADAAARHQRVLEHAPSLTEQAVEKVAGIFDDVRSSIGSFFRGGDRAPAPAGPLAPGPLAPPATASSQSWLPSWLQRVVADDGADGRIVALWGAEEQRRTTEISDADDLVDLRMELAGQKAKLSDTQVADIRAQLIGATGKLWNTHGDIFSALATLTPEQRDQIFGDPRGQDVLKELRRKILVNAGPGSSAARHFDQLMAATSSAEIKAISVHWAGKGGGTNEKTIDAVLDSMVEGQAAQVRAEFARLYGGDETIDEFLKDEYSNRDKSLNAARFEADKAKVAAIKMEMAAKGKGGLLSTSGGTNEEKYLTARQEIHDRYRGPFLSDADAQRAAAQERAELKRIDETLRDRIGMSMAELDEDEFGGKDEGRLREALAASRDLMIDPATPGLDPKVAARLATARDRFDANLALDFLETDEADAGMNQKAFAGKTKAQRDAIMAQASIACGEDFLTYADRKQRSPVERRKLREYARDGELSDEMALIDAMKGTGTKNDVVHQRIMGKSKEEIAELSERYRQAVVELGLTPDAVRSKIPGGNYSQYSYLAGAGGLGAGVDSYVYFQSLSGNLFDDIDSEMGGIKWKEIKYTLQHGTPQTPEEKLAYQQYLHDYVRHSGIMPQGFRDWSQGYEGEQSDAELARMETMVATFKKWGVAGLPMSEIPYVLLRRYQDGDPQFSDPKVVQDAIKELLAVEASTSAWTHGAETRDQATVNMIAQVAGLIVMGLVIVFTGGLAGPALVAVASMAGGLASIGIKLVMLGQKYSREELMTDLAATLVETLMGSIKLGPMFNKVATKMVTKFGVKGARAQRLLHNYITMSLDARQEGAEEFLQALLDSKTWDDAKDIDEVFGRAFHNAKLGAASSMTGTLGTNALLGYKKYRKQAERLNLGESMVMQTTTDMVAKAWVNDGEFTADDAFGSLVQGTRQTLMGRANREHSANSMRSGGVESRPYDDANAIAYERAKLAGAPKETLHALQQAMLADVQHRIDHANEVAALYRDGQISEEQAAEMMGSPFTIEERVRTMEQNREISPEMAAYILAPGGNTKQRFRLYAKVAGQNPIAHEQRVRERLAFEAIAAHDLDLDAKGAWPGLDVTWAQVRKELIERIGQPGLINITSVWLCGPTAMGNVFAEGDAHAYALRVMELFFHGTWKGKKVTQEMLSAPRKGGGSVVDWMFLTGFRNTHRNLTGKAFVGESGAHAAQWNLPFEVSGWLSKELDLEQTDSDLVNPEELLGKLDAINAFLPDAPDPSHDGVVIIMIGQSYASPSFDRDGNKVEIKGEKWFDKLQRQASDLIFAKRKMPHHYMRVMSKLVLQDAPEGTPAIKRQVKFKVFEHGRVYEDTMDLGNIYGVVRGRRPQPSLAHLQSAPGSERNTATGHGYAAFEAGLVPLDLTQLLSREQGDASQADATRQREVEGQVIADVETKAEVEADPELDAFEQAALALQAAKEARQAYEESLPEDINQWTEAQRLEFERLDEAENVARQRYQDAMSAELDDGPSGEITVNDAEALWEEFAASVIYRHGTSTNWYQMINERGLQAGNAPFDANARDWVDYILQRIYNPSAKWEDHEYGHSGEVFVTGKQELAEMYASEAGESVAGVIENVKRIFKLDAETLAARTTPEEREMLQQIAAHFQAIADNHQPLILNIRGSVLANRTDGPAGVEAVKEAIRQVEEESGTVTKEAVFRKLAPHEVRLTGVSRDDIVGLEDLDVTPATLPPLPKIPPKHAGGSLSDSNLGQTHITVNAAELADARATYGALIAQLELGDVEAGRGGKSAAMMAAISNVTGKELALLRLKDGRLVWRLGTATSIDLDFGEATIIAHVHPSGDLSFSQADLTELSLRGQHSSVLVGPTGAAARLHLAPTGERELGPQLDGDLRDVTPHEVATNLRQWADQLTTRVPKAQQASASKLQQAATWISSSVGGLFGKKRDGAPSLADQLEATPEAVVAQIGDALFDIDRMRALGAISPVEARRAVAALGRLLFALQRVAPQAVDANTLDWQQALMSQLTYELAAPTHQTAVEFETTLTDAHLKAMTTPDGTCGPVLDVGGAVTPALERLAKQLRVEPRQVSWDKLSLVNKHDLLNAQRSGADSFFGNRKLPGMVFRQGVGVDRNGVTFLVPRPEYGGPTDVGDITGLEYHSRRAGYASELTDDAFALEVSTFSGTKPTSSHQHIPFWLGNDVLSGNPIARAQLVDYYRRINTLVELYGAVFQNFAAAQVSSGNAIYFDFTQGDDLVTLDSHLGKAGGAGGMKMNVSALKLAMVGARTGDLLDGISNPNAWLDFELRHQGNLEKTDPAWRRAYTDAIQKAALARSYGISDASFIAWYMAQMAKQPAQKTGALVARQHYNRPSVLNEMSPALRESAEYKAAAAYLVDIGKSDYAQRRKDYKWEDYRVRMLVHDWSSDPVLAGKPDLAAQVLAAQKAALKRIAEVKPATRATPTDQRYGQIIREFVSASGLLTAYSESAGVDDVGLASNAKATGAHQRKVIELANALTRRGVAADVVAEFERQAANATTDADLDALVRSFAVRNRTGGQLHDVLSPQERWPIGTEFDFAERGRWRVVDHTGSVVNLESIDDPGLSHNIQVSQLEMVAPSATEPAFAPYAELWPPGTPIDLGPDGAGWIVTAHALGSVILQREGESRRVSPHKLLRLNPTALQVALEGQTWQVQSVDPATHVATLVNGDQTQALHVSALAAVARGDAPTFDHLPWTGTTLQQAIGAGRLDRVYQSAYGPIRVSGSVSTTDGLLKVGSLSIQNDLGYVEGGANIGPRLVMRMIQDLQKDGIALGGYHTLEIQGTRITGAKVKNEKDDKKQTIVRDLTGARREPRRDDGGALNDAGRGNVQIDVDQTLAAQAFEQYGDLMFELDQGDVPVGRGGKSAAMMAAISNATGRELALLRLTDGRMVWRLGTATSVSVGPDVATVIAHVHPSGELTYSQADVAELQLRDQRSSVLVAPSGEGRRLHTPDGGMPVGAGRLDDADADAPPHPFAARWPIGTLVKLGDQWYRVKKYGPQQAWGISAGSVNDVVHLQQVGGYTSATRTPGQLEGMADDAFEFPLEAGAALWPPGTKVNVPGIGDDLVITAHALGRLVVQRDGLSHRISPIQLLAANPGALQVTLEDEAWTVQSFDRLALTATLERDGEVRVVALADLKAQPGNAPRYDHLPWTGTTLEDAIFRRALERVYQSPYGPITVSGNVSTSDGKIKVGSLSIKNDLGYVEGGANIGPRLVMRMIQDLQKDGIALGGYHTLEIQGHRITGAKVRNEAGDKTQTIVRDLTGGAGAGGATTTADGTGGNGLADPGRGQTRIDVDQDAVAEAFEQYGELMHQLDQGDVEVGRGGKSAQMMAAVSNATGRELALLRLTDGRLVWRLGTATSVPVGTDVATVVAHVHPSGELSFSLADVAELQLRDQRSSVLVAPSGDGRRLPTPHHAVSPAATGALHDQRGVTQQWPVGTRVDFLDGSVWEVTRPLDYQIEARKLSTGELRTFMIADFTRDQRWDTLDCDLAPLFPPGLSVVGPDGESWTVTAHALGRVIIQRAGQSMRAQPLALLTANPGTLVVQLEGQPWVVREVDPSSRILTLERDGEQRLAEFAELAATPGTPVKFDHLPWTGSTISEAIAYGRLERVYQSPYGPITVYGRVSTNAGVINITGLGIKNDIGYAEGGANIGPRLVMRMVQDLQQDGIALGAYTQLRIQGTRITGAKVRNGKDDKAQLIVRDLSQGRVKTPDPVDEPEPPNYLGAIDDAGETHISVDAAAAAEAFERYGDLIYQLDQGDVLVGRGGKSAQMMAAISNATGRELALLRLTSGQQVWRLGDAGSVAVGPDVATVIAHVHPSGDLSFSRADVAELQLRDQRSSVLVAPTGTATRLEVPRDGRGGATSAVLEDPAASPHAPFASLWPPGLQVMLPGKGDDFVVTAHALGQVIVQRGGNESVRVSPYELFAANPGKLSVSGALADGEAAQTWVVVGLGGSTLDGAFGSDDLSRRLGAALMEAPTSVTVTNGSETRDIDLTTLSTLATTGRRPAALANHPWTTDEFDQAVSSGSFKRTYWSAFGPITCGGDVSYQDGVLRVGSFWIKNDLGYVEGGAPIGARGVMVMIQDLENVASMTGDVTRLEVSGYRITGAKKANNASDRNQTIVRDLTGGRGARSGGALSDVDGAHIELDPDAIARAFEQHGDLIAELELGDVPAARGGKSVAMMAAISAATGRELGLLRLTDGRLVWRLGDASSIAIGPEVATIVAHVHPSGDLRFSAADVAELQQRDQRSSVLVSPTGEGKRLGTPGQGPQGPVVRGEEQAHVRAWADELARSLTTAASLDAVGSVGAVLALVQQNLFALERDRALGVASLTNSRRTAAALGRLMFAIERVAPGTVPAALLDWQEAVAAQLTYEHAAPGHQTAVEFETDLRAAHLEAMTTADGTCGPVIAVGRKTTEAVRQRATALGVEPRAVPWDDLSGAEKLELLNVQRQGDFFSDRKLPGLVFRPGYGVDDQGRTFLESRPEYGGPSDVGSISGLEYHTRREGFASQLADESFNLEVETFGGDKPSSSHQHIPFWLGTDVLKSNPVARAQLVDYYRRINLLAELWASVYEGYSAHRISQGSVTYFDFASAQSMTTLDKHLHAVTTGRWGKMDKSTLKLAMVGARTGDLLDGLAEPDRWLDFELRNQGGFEHADPEFRRAYTDAIQKAALARSFGISNTQFMAWFEAMTAGKPMSTDVTGGLIARQHYNRPGLLAQMHPELAASPEYAAAKPYLVDLNSNDYAQRHQDYPHEDYRLRMLVHDWSTDPVFANDPDGPARVLEAQKRALAKLAGLKPHTRAAQGEHGAGHIQHVVVEFIRESGLVIDFELSVGIDDLGLAAHHDPSPGVTDYRIKQLAQLLTRAGLAHDDVFDFRMEAKTLTDVDELGALVDAYLARRGAAGGKLHDAEAFTTVATLRATATPKVGQVTLDVGDVRLDGSGGAGGAQELVIELPPERWDAHLVNIEIAHSQVLTEKSVPWSGTKDQLDEAPAYSLVEVFVEGVGWTSMGQRQKFAEARTEIRIEAENLHDLQRQPGRITKVRVRSVGIDPVHVHGLVFDYLPARPTSFTQAMFTPGMDFGDMWADVPPTVVRDRSVDVPLGTRYPDAVILNNPGDWAVTTPATLARATQLGWIVEADSILIPLTPGKTFKSAEVALGDTHPDSDVNEDGSQGAKGKAKLSLSIERNGAVVTQLTRDQNVPPQGVHWGVGDHVARAGDYLRVKIGKDTAGIMGVRIGYDDGPTLDTPTPELGGGHADGAGAGSRLLTGQRSVDLPTIDRLAALLARAGLGDAAVQQFRVDAAAITDVAALGALADRYLAQRAPGAGGRLNDVAAYTTVATFQPPVTPGTTKVIARLGDVKLLGSHGGAQELIIDVPEALQGAQLANMEIVHSQVLREKSTPWSGSKSDNDASAPYSLVEVFVEGQGWTNLGQRKKFAEARAEAERLHDLPPVRGKILKVRVRNVGIDPVHVHSLALDFLPAKPQHFDEGMFTPGTSFGDPWSGRGPTVARKRDQRVDGTRYPNAIILNNPGDWAPTSDAAQAAAAAKGWIIQRDALLVPLTPGKRFRVAEVALGDTHPDDKTNADGSYGYKGYAKLSLAIVRNGRVVAQLTSNENVPPQGVLLGVGDYIAQPGDMLAVQISADTAGIMGVRVGYDDVASLEDPEADFGTSFTPIDRSAGGSQGGRWYADEHGTNYFGKQYKGSTDRMAVEMLANRIYRMFGISAADNRVVLHDGVPTLMSKELKGAINGGALASTDVGEGFVIDAWLANHDVTGASGDNMLVDGHHTHRIDNGSAFVYRARGDLKPYGAEVGELDSMRDPRFPAGRLAFGGLSDAEVLRQLEAFKARYAALKSELDVELLNAGMSPDLLAKSRLACTPARPG
jgi:hypothetical protein